MLHGLIYILLGFIITVVLPGCSIQKSLPPTLESIKPDEKQTVKTVPQVDDEGTKEGLYYQEGKTELLIKYRNKSFITIIDELFYKKRINYTLLTDISKYYMTICDDCSSDLVDWHSKKQKRFAHLAEFLDYAIKDINSESEGIKDVCFPFFCESDIRDPARLIEKIRTSKDSLSKYIRNILYSQSSPVEVTNTSSTNILVEQIKNEFPIAEKLNALLKVPLYSEEIFSHMTLSEGVKKLISKKPSGNDLIKLNRYLLEEAYPEEIITCRKLRYRFIGDGIEFYETNAIQDDDASYYKKIFLYNLTVKEAEEKLGTLFPISYASKLPAQYTQMSPQMNPQVSQTENQSGQLISLPFQNALFIRANKSLLDKISQVIFSLDAESSQVLVETKVFEYDDSLAREIGAAIDYTRNIKEGNKTETYSLKTLFGEGISETISPILTFGLNKMTDSELKYNLLSKLALYDRDGKVKIAAEPRLLLKPGSTAEINLNTVKYVITSNLNYSDVKPIETGVKFKITPTILSENKINLDLEVEQSEFIPTNEANIVLSSNKNTVKTSVTVNDGELISLGGIKTRKHSTFSSGIPYLKDIPIIGYVFGSKVTDYYDVRVEFMIRPTIKNYKKKSIEILNQIFEKESVPE